jgi:hypothetical protein
VDVGEISSSCNKEGFKNLNAFQLSNSLLETHSGWFAIMHDTGILLCEHKQRYSFEIVLFVRPGFWGGLTPENGDNETALAELLDAGVLGLKVGTDHSWTQESLDVRGKSRRFSNFL